MLEKQQLIPTRHEPSPECHQVFVSKIYYLLLIIYYLSFFTYQLSLSFVTCQLSFITCLSQLSFISICWFLECPTKQKNSEIVKSKSGKKTGLRNEKHSSIYRKRFSNIYLFLNLDTLPHRAERMKE
jgi:hypothetical protein